MHYNLPHIGLLTDYYQLTMAQAYFDRKRHNLSAVFHLFFRKNPFKGNFTLAAGIDDALQFIERYKFDKESLQFLRSLQHNNKPIFTDEFLQFLSTLKVNIDVFGVNNGEVVFPHEPVLRIEGPLLLCQLLETPLLNIINFQSLIATKAARMVMAAQQKPIIDFGLRRAHGFDGAISASKAAYLGGISATSNLWASKAFSIPKAGTQAHSFIMSYPEETSAFSDFATSWPESCILLIDTYDPQRGIEHAIATFRAKKTKNPGIRIDSGDLLSLSRMARSRLNDAGFPHCSIIVSGDLDEYEIARLEQASAPIDCYGVGTKLITAFDEPSLGGVYKLAAIKDEGRWRDTFKTSASSVKSTQPGAKTIARYLYKHHFVCDQVFNKNLAEPPFIPPLPFDEVEIIHQSLMKDGLLVAKGMSLTEARTRAKTRISSLPLNLNSLMPREQSYPLYFDNGDINESIIID